MNRSDQEHTRIVRAWLDEGTTELSPRVHDAVLREFPATTQDRPFWSSRRPRVGAFAAVAVGGAAAIIIVLAGARMLPGGGPGGPGPDTAPSSSPGPLSTPDTGPASPRCGSSRLVGEPSVPSGVGLIGLPQIGAASSTPEVGELVECYWLTFQGGPPYFGSARLYADGRLIWNVYLTQDRGASGYIEQRLTADGVALVLAHGDTNGKHPLTLPTWLPASAWEDVTVRPYVPAGYAACLLVSDSGAYASFDVPLDEKLAILPPSAAELLRDKKTLTSSRPASLGATASPGPVPLHDGVYPEDEWHCLRMTTQEARVLDAALRDAGFEQEEWRNRHMLEYHTDFDGDGPEDRWLNIWFEPILPDGTITCSSCG